MDAANKIRYKEDFAIIGVCIKVSDYFQDYNFLFCLIKKETKNLPSRRSNLFSNAKEKKLVLRPKQLFCVIPAI
jgi:hypothetical protein